MQELGRHRLQEHRRRARGEAARDYETLPGGSEVVIHIASIDSRAKRTTDETTPTWLGTY
ncbi:hypothetical protein [Streptomyces cyaneus]|uniref:hypothetical protein n=1 Tax=Streptomyces cyaneus TaxID=1904 RepID=UPI003CCC8D5F